MVLTLLALNCGAKDFDRVLRVRGDADYPPYEFLDAQGQPAGFNVELFQAVAEAMDLQSNIELGPWSEVRGELESGETDMLMGMFRSPERSAAVDFSLAHTVVSHCLFVRQDSPIRELGDLHSGTILVQRGDIMDDFASRTLASCPILRFATPLEALKALQGGEGDAALLPRVQGLHLCRTHHLRGIEAVGPPMEPTEYCFAVRRGDAALLALLNEGLTVLQANGTYELLRQKWFGVHSASFWQRQEVRYLILLMLLAIFLLMTMVVRDQRLQRSLRRNQRETAELEARWNLALEASSLGVFDWDIMQDRAVYSDQYCRLLGHEPGSLNGSPALWRERVHPDDLALPQERLDAHLRGETEHFEAECRIRAADGSYRWFSARGKVIERANDGSPRRLLGILSDITERKLMELELQHAKDLLEQRVQERTSELAERMAEAEQINRAMTNVLEDLQDTNRKLERVSAALAESNRELEAFAHSVSHDLRAPLRAIDGFAGIIAEDYGNLLDAEGHRLLGVVRENARRMGQLIGDLLAFARLGRQPLVKSAVPLAEVVGELVAEQIRATEGNAEFVVQDLPPVHGDRGMLRQVFANLLDNAVKYSQPKAQPRIVIGGSCEPGWVHCWVTDNGIGFEQKYAEKIFAVFERLHPPEHFAGTGVGLSLVQRIVLRHGGTAWAEGEPERGATFHIRLPDQTGGLPA
jgi:PAS domain S-box-containing protein